MKNTALSKGRSIIYCVLSFILSVVLLLFSLFTVLEITLLNPDFIYDNMNSASYFTDKQNEINRAFLDLGYASGLDDSFWADFPDNEMLESDTRKYLDGYYSGECTGIDPAPFKEKLNRMLDDYISENKLPDVNEAARKYLVQTASNTYRSSLDIPLFSRISFYVVAIKNIIPSVLIGLGLFAIIIISVIVFTNRKRIDGLRYICYATSASFLTVGIIPAFILLSDKLKYINLSSQAFYNFVLSAATGLCMDLIICAIIFLLISLVLLLIYRWSVRKLSE